MTHPGSMPLISIILPTYNRGAVIGETLRSIIRQTYTNWELLVVDDGSADNTVELMTHYADARINILEAGRIGILGRLKNMGIAQANGDLIAFMDSDDLWDEGKLALQVDALARYPGAGFCLTGGFSFKKLDEPIDYYYPQKSGERYGDLLVPFFRSEIAALTPSLLFRKTCLDTINGFDESRLFSDIDFLLKLIARYPGVILYAALLYRRLHEENTTNYNWELGYTEYAGLITEYQARGIVQPGIARNALFRLFVNYGEKCLRYGHPEKARRIFRSAWQNKPLSFVAIKKIIKSYLPRPQA